MLYEFVCEQCGQVTEKSRPISQAPELGTPTPCLYCGGTARRVISRTANFADAQVKHQTHAYPFESISLTGLDGCEEGPNGGSVIRSPSHRREVMARNNLGWR